MLAAAVRCPTSFDSHVCPSRRRWILKRVLLASLAVLAAPPITRAQNLLSNPSLEGLAGFPIPPGSCPGQPGDEDWRWRFQCIPEIEPPTWWYPFWNDGPSASDPETDYRRPEFRVYAWPDGPHFACHGSKYLVFFGFFGAIDAGIYQQVTVTAGRPYEFRYQAFAWSNCLDGKVPGSGLGCDDFPTYQAVFKAGIDPAGGTDYTSGNIVWSAGSSIYDAYAPVFVTATAAASTITVFVRCTFWHNYIQHNDAHVDALELVELGTPLIGLSTERIDRAVYLGDPPPADDVFTVANSTGIDTLNYTVSEETSWLSVAPTSGASTGEADPITITYASDISSLPVGNYTAVITVASADATNSPRTLTVHLTVQVVRPDLDQDDDVDQTDFGLFQACYTGMGVAPAPACAAADLDRDDDVDLVDFAAFQKCLSGAGVPVDRGCAPRTPDPLW